MNALEKIILGLLSAAPAVAPIFIHSANGTAVLNVSEVLFSGILAEFSPKAPAAPAAVAPNGATSGALAGLVSISLPSATA